MKHGAVVLPGGRVALSAVHGPAKELQLAHLEVGNQGGKADEAVEGERRGRAAEGEVNTEDAGPVLAAALVQHAPGGAVARAGQHPGGCHLRGGGDQYHDAGEMRVTFRAPSYLRS